MACPNFYFHLNFTGTRTFHIENSNDPTDFIDVTGTGSIDAWEFNSELGNPCGLTFGAGICYTFYEVTAHTTGDEKIAIQFTGDNPNHLTIDYDGINRTFSVSTLNPGNPDTYSISWGNDSDNPPTCPVLTCNYDYFILYNYYYQYNGITQPPPAVAPSGFTFGYTLSDTFIYVADSSIPANANVTLDANPLNDGYIWLDVGFETQSSSVFKAIVETPCPTLGLSTYESEANITIYPNPVIDVVSIEAKAIIEYVEVIDINGRIILTKNNKESFLYLNLEPLVAGVYLMRVTTDKGFIIKKIIKR